MNSVIIYCSMGGENEENPIRPARMFTHMHTFITNVMFYQIYRSPTQSKEGVVITDKVHKTIPNVPM
jgi:hypothetical protein